MSVQDTKLTNIAVSDQVEVDFKYAESVYTIKSSQLTAQFEYTWKMTVGFIPFTHTHSCRLTIPSITIMNYFQNTGTKDLNTVKAEIGDQDTYLACDDTGIMNQWGYKWMKSVREYYNNQQFKTHMGTAVETWFLEHNKIFDTVQDLKVGDYQFKLEPQLKQMKTQTQGNIIFQYAYQISLGNKQLTTPTTSIGEVDFRSVQDEAIYIFPEFLSSLLSLQVQSKPLNLQLEPSSFTTDLTWGLTVKDWIHVISGLSNFEDNIRLATDCVYNGDVPKLTIGTTGVETTFPVKCEFMRFDDKGAKQHLVNFQFTLKVTSEPDVAMSMNSKYLALVPKKFEVIDYQDSDEMFTIDRFMKERIAAYAEVVYGNPVLFVDGRLSLLKMISKQVTGGFIKIDGTLF